LRKLRKTPGVIWWLMIDGLSRNFLSHKSTLLHPPCRVESRKFTRKKWEARRISRHFRAMS